MRSTTNPPVRPTQWCDRSPPGTTNGLPAGNTNTDCRTRPRVGQASSAVHLKGCCPPGGNRPIFKIDNREPHRVGSTWVAARYRRPDGLRHTSAGDAGTKESRTWQTHGDFPALPPTGGTGSCSAPVAAWPVRSSSTRKVSAARQGPAAKEKRKPSAWTAPSSPTAEPTRWPSTNPTESGAGCRSRSGHPC